MNKKLLPILALVAVAAAWYYFKVIAKRPSNYASLTPRQRRQYDAALAHAAALDGSQFE